MAPGKVCTSHVLRMYEDQAMMTIAWYSQGVRVLDIAGLADYEPPAGGGDAAVAFGDGIGMTEIGSYVFPDANTWSFETNRIAKDGSFYGYGNDLNRGMDVYRFVPGQDRPTAPAPAPPGQCGAGIPRSRIQAVTCAGGIGRPIR